jgi:hypothetical protein
MNSRSDAWLAVTSAHIPHYGHIAVIVGTLYPEDHRVSVRGDRSRMVRRAPTARSFKATHMRCLTSTAAPISSTQHEICSSAKGIAASAAVGYMYTSPPCRPMPSATLAEAITTTPIRSPSCADAGRTQVREKALEFAGLLGLLDYG